MKKIFLSGLMGLPIGISVTVLILFFESAVYGGGTFLVGVPAFVEQCGSEVTAMGVQLLVSAIFGFIIGAAGNIWKKDHWSLAKQTVLHFLVLSMTSCGAAYVCHWMPHTASGIAIYFATMILIYVVIWLVSFFTTRRKISRINRKLEK